MSGFVSRHWLLLAESCPINDAASLLLRLKHIAQIKSQIALQGISNKR